MSFTLNHWGIIKHQKDIAKPIPRLPEGTAGSHSTFGHSEEDDLL